MAYTWIPFVNVAPIFVHFLPKYFILGQELMPYIKIPLTNFKYGAWLPERSQGDRPKNSTIRQWALVMFGTRITRPGWKVCKHLSATGQCPEFPTKKSGCSLMKMRIQSWKLQPRAMMTRISRLWLPSLLC